MTVPRQHGMTAAEVVGSLRRIPWWRPVVVRDEEGGTPRYACRACLAVIDRRALGAAPLPSWPTRTEVNLHLAADHPELQARA